MKPLINGCLRACSQVTANPVAVPIKAPAITSVGKWYPASTRSKATLPPIAITAAQSQGAPPCRAEADCASTARAAKTVEV